MFTAITRILGPIPRAGEGASRGAGGYPLRAIALDARPFHPLAGTPQLYETPAVALQAELYQSLLADALQQVAYEANPNPNPSPSPNRRPATGDL